VGLGAGTNTRAELLSLWALLWLANKMACDEILVLGDSQAIIDWINGKSQIMNTTLTHWHQRVVYLKEAFAHITIQHIYREHNMLADTLSKDGLTLEEGYLWYIDVNSSDIDEWEILNIY